jgi:hypothetical protein
MGAQGTATVDFGAFPGKSDASVDVTGQTAITGASLVEAWLYPSATADHSADEHLVESIRVMAGNVSAGVGFTIYAFNSLQIPEPLVRPGERTIRRANATVGLNFKGPGDQMPSVGGRMPMIYGQWTVAWVWN